MKSGENDVAEARQRYCSLLMRETLPERTSDHGDADILAAGASTDCQSIHQSGDSTDRQNYGLFPYR
jgi:hypothetical protein